EEVSINSQELVDLLGLNLFEIDLEEVGYIEEIEVYYNLYYKTGTDTPYQSTVEILSYKNLSRGDFDSFILSIVFDNELIIEEEKIGINGLLSSDKEDNISIGNKVENISDYVDSNFVYKEIAPEVKIKPNQKNSVYRIYGNPEDKGISSELDLYQKEVTEQMKEEFEFITDIQIKLIEE
ncbi:MAG: hypothetical protein ACOC4G_06770, partial [Bacillota bacterium]